MEKRLKRDTDEGTGIQLKPCKEEGDDDSG